MVSRPPSKTLDDSDAGVELSWVEGRVHVVNVRKGSRADRAGLFVGDEILYVLMGLMGAVRWRVHTLARKACVPCLLVCM